MTLVGLTLSYDYNNSHGKCWTSKSFAIDMCNIESEYMYLFLQHSCQVEFKDERGNELYQLYFL